MHIPFLSYLLPTRYFTKQLPTCPLCGEKNPRWHVFHFIGVGSVRRYAARCENCKGLLSFQSSDVTGDIPPNLSIALFLNIFSRKPLGEPYVMIESEGLVNLRKLAKRSEYRITELRSISETAGE